VLTTLALAGAPPLARAQPVSAALDAGARLPTDLDAGPHPVVTGEPFSAATLRESLDGLYATSRFADVLATSTPTDGGITVSFLLTPPQKLTRLAFEGNQALSHGALTRVALLALEVNRNAGNLVALPSRMLPEELDKMTLALKHEYALRGYELADVTAHPTLAAPGEIAVAFTVVENAPTRLAAFSASGDPRLDPKVLLEASGLSLGDVLDRKAVRAAVGKLKARYQKSSYYRAQLTPAEVVPLGPLRSAVAFPIDAGPQMRFHFHHAESFSSAVLLQQLGFNPEEPLDSTEAERMAERVQRFYQRSGFFDARVAYEEHFSPDKTKLVIVFDVEEGLPLLVKRVDFVGNKHFSRSYLQDRLDESLAAVVPLPPDFGKVDLDIARSLLLPSDEADTGGRFQVTPSTVFDLDAYREAASRVVDLYKADGYLKATAEADRLDINDADRVAVASFTIVEGPRTMVKDQSLVEVQPDAAKTIKAPEQLPDATRLLLSLSTLKRGAPYSAYEEEATRLAILHELHHRGFLFAKVTADDKDLPEGGATTQREVIFKAEPGKLVHVSDVIIKGNDHTLNSVVLAALPLQQGDVFDSNLLVEGQRNLLALNIFNRVELRPLNPEREDDTKALVVDIEEKPRTELELLGGASAIDGPRVGFSLVESNLFGSGLQGTAQAKLNYFNLSVPTLTADNRSATIAAQNTAQNLYGFGGHVNLGLADPQLFFLPSQRIGVRVDVVGERLVRPIYSFTRAALLPGIDWHISRTVLISLGAELEADDIQKPAGLADIIDRLTPSDLQQLRFEGSAYLATLQPSITWDNRDNTTNPHKGWLIGAGTELVHSFLDANSSQPSSFYLKPQVNLTVYVPLGDRMTFALSGRGGQIIALASSSRTIPPKRYFLGGASTLRGYGEDGLTPEDDRASLLSQRQNCRALVNTAGCSSAATLLDRGNQVPSEGGNAFVLYKAELRIKLSGDLELGLFVDAGNLWVDPKLWRPFDVSQFRFTPGFGIRYGTPVGPLSLDFGFNPAADDSLNESVFSVKSIQFSIGLF
jgi:outer membrane protein assembly factor BamA